MHPSPSTARLGTALLAALLATAPAAAGVRALFFDGFESGDTAAWERATRCVVFEGFYVPT
jgi:hypothetical protein